MSKAFVCLLVCLFGWRAVLFAQTLHCAPALAQENKFPLSCLFAVRLLARLTARLLAHAPLAFAYFLVVLVSWFFHNFCTFVGVNMQENKQHMTR